MVEAGKSQHERNAGGGQSLPRHSSLAGPFYRHAQRPADAAKYADVKMRSASLAAMQRRVAASDAPASGRPRKGRLQTAHANGRA